MRAVQFDAELSGTGVLVIPSEVAAKLPMAGRVRVIVLTEHRDADDDDAEWNRDAYEQFLRDDSPEDDIYESLR